MFRQYLKTIRHSLYIKIMSLFLLVIIPLFLLGLSIYLWGYDMVKKEINHSSVSQINLYTQSIENEISRIQKLQYEFVNDQDLLYLTNAFEIMDSFELSQYMLRIQNRLEILNNSSNYMKDVVVHIPRLGKSISSTQGVEPLWKNWNDTITNMYQADSCGILFKNNQIIMDISYPVNIKKEKSPLIMVEIILSNQSIIETLNGFNQYPDSAFLIVNQNQTYLLTTNPYLEIDPHTFEYINESSAGTFSYQYESTPTLVTYSHLNRLNMQLISIVPTNHILGKIQQFKVFFILFMIALIVVTIIFTIFIRLMIHKPFKSLIYAIKEVQTGNLNVAVRYTNQDEFQYLYQAFDDMTRDLQELIHMVYEQKLLAQRSELKQLQSQINPHFLYNSFFNIYRMAKDEDNENIATFSQYLGTYYQYITRNAQENVCLSAEYDNARTYLNIQGMRFHNRLKITMQELPETAHSIIVPRLIIQPVIENAFDHGLKTIEYPMICVTCCESINEFRISIEDNGPSLSKIELTNLEAKLHCYDIESETTGIVNIHRRLQLYFNSNAGIILTQSELGGLKVTIYLPKLEGGI